MKYRTKPIEIEAIRWTGLNLKKSIMNEKIDK